MLSTVRKIFSLFSNKERRHIYFLFALVFVSGLIEVAGIASIMPFLAVMASPEIVETNTTLSTLYDITGVQSTNRFLFLLGGLALIVLIVNNTFRALSIWLLYRFVWISNHQISKRLLGRYLKQPYVFFLNRNSSGLSKNILAEVEAVISGVLIPGLKLVSKSFVVLLIVGFLFVVDPVLSIIVALVMGGFYGVVYFITRRKLVEYGKLKIRSNEQRYTSVSEAFGGIKDVKLLGREALFLDTFAKPSKNYGKARTYATVAAQIPRSALEVMAFGGILLILLYLLKNKESFEQVIPVIGMYAFAGYRLMPAMQEVFAGVASIRGHEPALDLLVDELKVIEMTSGEGSGDASCTDESLPFEDILEFSNVSFRYPGADEDALKNISIVMEANKTYGLVGTTGCGKTTTVDILLGLLRPQDGVLRVDNTIITESNLRAWQDNLGYVPQDIYLSDQSIKQNIAFGVPEEDVDMDAVEAAARIAKIHGFIISELPDDYETIVGERGVRLSGGQKQRIGIARALYHNPRALILDEATSALDGVTENSIMDAISDLSGQKTIIMIAHRLSTVRACDEIFLLDKGKVLGRGTYEELVATNTKFRHMAASQHGY